MSFLMRRIFLPLALLISCLLLGGWNGAFRTKDLAAFKLWLPLSNQNEIPVAFEGVSRVGAGGQRFEIRATLAANSAGASTGQGSAGLAKYYGIFSEDAVSHRVELLSRNEEPSATPRSGAGATLIFKKAADSDLQVAQGLEMEGRLYQLEAPVGISKGTPEWSGLAQVSAREFLSVVRGEESQFVVLLRVPAPEAQQTSVKGLPLVELSKLGINEPLTSIALLNDAKTLALLPQATAGAATELGFPFWLVRLPGALVVSSLPVYIAAVIAVVVSCVLLMFGFKKSPQS
jgi:hypothetical protein